MNDKNIGELLLELEEVGMKDSLDQTWLMTKPALLGKFKETCEEFNNKDSFFIMIFLIGMTGTVLADKYLVDKDELIEIFEEVSGIKFEEIK